MIKESDLKDILKNFSNIPIRISFNGALIGNVEFKESKCYFSKRDNKLRIKEKKSNNIINIDTKPLYKIELSKEYNILYLYLDYNLIISIEKI